MTTKDELVKKIKEWIQNDDNITNLQKSIKECRANKKKLTDDLIEIMKTNDIDCFDVNSGKIIFYKNKVRTPLNKKSLLISLGKYFDNDPNIDTEKIGNFILENREIKIKENLRRKQKLKIIYEYNRKYNR